MDAIIEVFGRSNRLESKRVRSQASVQVDQKRDSVTISIRTNNTHDIYISRSIVPSIFETGVNKGIKVYIPEYRTSIHLSSTEHQSIDDIYSLLSSSSSSSSTSTPIEKENTSPNIGRKADIPKQIVSKPSTLKFLAAPTRPQSALSTLVKSTNASTTMFVSPKKLTVKPLLDGINNKRSPPPKSKFLSSPEGGSTSLWAKSPDVKKGKFRKPTSPGDNNNFKMPTMSHSHSTKTVAIVDNFRVASERCTPPKPAVPKFSVSQGMSKKSPTGRMHTTSQFTSPSARNNNSNRSPVGQTPYKITDEQEIVLKSCCDDSLNVFFSGSAGTGKSSLLKVIIEALHRKHGANSVFVTATTGLAACAIEGTTVHQFAGISVAHESESGSIPQIVSKVSLYIVIYINC